MKIDIEKLNRKTPYPEPSEDFFKQMQANVISQTVGKEAIVMKKETKVFALNFKWMAAAAVILIGGITAFFSLNNDQEVSIAQQAPIVDSVYEVEQPIQKPAVDLLADNTVSSQPKNKISETKQLKQTSAMAVRSSASKTKTNSDQNMIDRQTYAVGTQTKSKMDVEKVLAAFTPDQLKDIDRNSEQDVYLDLYN